MSRIFCLSLFLFYFLLPSCSDGVGGNSGKYTSIPPGQLEQMEVEDAYGNTEIFTRRKDNYAREGLYVKLSPQGERLEEAVYRNDTLNGWRILYYESGDTQVLENYLSGEFEGLFQAFYPAGQLEIEGQYEGNVMSGQWKRYYKNGQLMEIVTFSDNEENGPFKEYHENGRLKAEGYYRNGDNEHGSLKLYDDEGLHVKTMNCENGICHTIWEKEEREL